MLIVCYEAPLPKVKIPNFGEMLVREEGPGVLSCLHLRPQRKH